MIFGDKPPNSPQYVTLARHFGSENRCFKAPAHYLDGFIA